MKPVDEEQELTRLLAQETSPLASGLGALRERGPNAAELASLASRLALQGFDVSEPPLSAAPPNPWRKWRWGGLGGVSSVVLWLALRGPHPAPVTAPTLAHGERLPTSPAVLVVPGATEQRASSRAGTSAAPTQAPLGEGLTAGVQETPGPAAEVLTAPPGVAVTTLEARPKSATGPAQPNGGLLVPVNGAAGAAGVAGASPRAHAAPPAGSGGTDNAPAAVGKVAAPSEIELLRDARFALHQSPARALELSDEHGRLYPQGKLTQERELIAVSALVALGRRTAALSRAASFERQYPTSPYRKQMADLLR